MIRNIKIKHIQGLRCRCISSPVVAVPAVVIEVVVKWWLGRTNDEPRWLIVVGMDQQERTNDEPTWLVVTIGVWSGRCRCGPARTNRRRA